MGFNCVKYWVQWRASSPQENVYLFDDIAELMDLADKYHLKVVLNVIFDVAPAWFYRKYPDAAMITADGAVLQPRALSYRQIGGAPGPCYHHEQAQQEKDRFLTAAVQALKDHPALWVWDLWNEPELTTGVKRTLSFDNQVCYCDHSVKAFSGWLQQKYGTLDAFNEKWQRTYADWQEAEPPRGQAVFNDFVDWRLFMSDALTEDLKRRAAVVKAYDLEHPIMVHTVPAPIFNLITAGSDDFKLAEPCDLFGNSLGSSAWSADLLISAAKGKKIINSEIHALPGHTAMKPKKLEFRELKQHILIPLARGITGFLFWQYRPEVLGHEAPAWGSTYLDGSETPWLSDMAALNLLIQEKREVLEHAVRPSDGIAILFSSENQIANFAAYAHLDSYNDSVQGTHKLLHDLNYKVEFIHELDVTETTLANYRCLWMPYPLYLNERLCSVIKKWVADGGILIAECSFGALTAENGSHSYNVPGYGFEDVFGVRESWIHSVEHLDHSYHNVTITSTTTIPLISAVEASVEGEGAYYKSDLDLQKEVKVIAEYGEDRSPAITSTVYGKGKAIYIGTLLAAAYWQNGSEGNLQMVRTLLMGELGLRPSIEVRGGTIRADMSEWTQGKQNNRLLFLHNWGTEAATAAIELPAAVSSVKPWFEAGAEAIGLHGTAATGLTVRLEAGDIQVYELV